MDLDLETPPAGKYPYRLSTEDRFQPRVRVQPVADCLEIDIRYVDTRLAAAADRRAWMGNPRTHSVKSDDDRADNILRATQRAQRRIRLLCLQAQVDRMFTFTTRAVLQRDDVLHAWDLFRRSMEKHYPGFRYVATMELHPKGKPGHIHIHAGLAGFYNINVLRRLWHHALNTVMGRPLTMTSGPESPGNVNIPPSRRRHHGNRAALAIASYIAKYVGKGMLQAFNRKRYLQSKSIKLSPAQSKWLQSESIDDALIEVCTRYDLPDNLEACTVHRHGMSVFIRVPISALPPPPF